MNWLTDTVALVTGAGSGIGKSMTRHFVEEGARVVAFDISQQRLTALHEELGERIAPVCGDVRSFEDNRKAVDTAVSSFGALDVFVGNAGIWDANRRLGELSETELTAGFEEVFSINVRGYLLGAKAAVPELTRSKGCMVFTLSTSSYFVGGGGPLYVASKHATLGIVRALAHELAPDIRVNGVAPSGTPTAMADAQSLATQAPGSGSGDTPVVPGDPRSNLLNLAVQPEDHTGAYVLLASRHSRFMTGAIINSDGGRGVMGPRVG